MLSTLVLNASYEPLSIIPASKALVRVLHGKAVSLEDSTQVWHDATGTEHPLPYVILLTRLVKRSNNARPAPWTKRNVLVRDNWTCVYCGKFANTIDHVVPRAAGGQNSYENCVAACQTCNRRKGHQPLESLGWSLSFKPKAPTLYAKMLGSHARADHQMAAWSQYFLTWQPDLAHLFDQAAERRLTKTE